MAQASAIEWTEATWNPVTGCSQVSPGCAHCYAKTFAERWRGTPGHPYEQGFDLKLWPERLDVPLRWRKPRTIFVNSMSDLFHEDIPLDFIQRVFATMRSADWHTFQILTKRADRLAELADQLDWAPNVWMGISVENRRFVHRADALRTVPAVVRFISAEPLLGPLDDLDLREIDWLIAGGESGPRHRRIDPAWVRDLRDRCVGDGVAFFFKQWGGARPKSGGRELDGLHWDELPEPRVVADRGSRPGVLALTKALPSRDVDIGDTPGEARARYSVAIDACQRGHADDDCSDVMEGHSQLVAFIWSVADLLRGDYKQSEYGKVILPLTVLRRLDCVLEESKADVLAAAERHANRPNPEPMLRRAAKDVGFYNTSQLDFGRLLADPQQLAGSLRAYIAAFSPGAFETFQRFNFDEQITRLDDADLLYLVVGRFADTDLHPDRVTNLQMGYVFEELIRRFSEQSNETAGEHFTPREVIRLMVNLLFATDTAELRTEGIVKTIYDPACGTGGMLSVAEDYLRDLNPGGDLHVFGQELNAESYAICRSDMMLKGHGAENIAFGNTLTADQHPRQFDYMLSNPPFGVEWKKIEAQVRDERDTLGHDGRFGAGLPRINDGSFLFLQHMISKMKPAEHGGSRIAIVFNGSPLFTGAAGSGESEIRRWIIENDWLDAVVGLPDQLFYNTGISTYIWLVTNAKGERRRGRVQLIDAREQWEKMPKSLGEKRKRIPEAAIGEITRWYADFAETDTSKVCGNRAFGFRRITVERPVRVRVEVAGARERLDALAAKLGQSAVEALRAVELHETIGAGTSVEDATALLAKAIPKLPAAKRKLALSAFVLRDPDGDVIHDAKGRPEPDPELRDQENVPLEQDVADYLAREVLPFAPDAWIDETKTVVGYEIPLTRHFYRYTEPRSLEEIDAEIDEVEHEILQLLAEVRE